MHRLACLLSLILACPADAVTDQEPPIVLEDTTVIGIPYTPPVTAKRPDTCIGQPIITQDTHAPDRWRLHYAVRELTGRPAPHNVAVAFSPLQYRSREEARSAWESSCSGS